MSIQFRLQGRAVQRPDNRWSWVLEIGTPGTEQFIEVKYQKDDKGFSTRQAAVEDLRATYADICLTINDKVGKGGDMQIIDMLKQNQPSSK